jgi:hypothetical protein
MKGVVNRGRSPQDVYAIEVVNQAEQLHASGTSLTELVAGHEPPVAAAARTPT